MKPTHDDLRLVEALSDLGDEELDWIAAHTEVRSFADGEMIVHAGDEAGHMLFLLSGQIDFSGEQGGQPVHFVVRQGEVSGMLPRSRMTHFPSTGRAVGLTRVGMLARHDFPGLAAAVPTLDARLLAIMTRRIRDAAHAEEQRERMSALGKLSAGLAHELNNPAAAVRRGAADLEARLQDLPEVLSALLEGGVGGPDLERARALLEMAAARQERLGALAQADAEDELAGVLQELGVPGAPELSGALIDGGVRPADLDWLRNARGQAAAIARYLAFSLGSRASLRDIRTSAGRISDLVASVKRYSHMDRGGDHQPTDVRAGLESTLTMLAHKLRDRHIRVERDFALDAPSVIAAEGELNQVWTNLIDNAADAMHGGGTLTLRVAPRAEQLAVSVIDTGPGIPPEIQARIFEPFFTTKGVGEGSGLGLDLVQRVVVRQHGGLVRLSSEPGHTEFLVLLPTKRPAPKEAETAWTPHA